MHSNKTYYELNLSFFNFPFAYCKFNRISKFKRILNANTHNIRITNADGQVDKLNKDCINSSSWIRGHCVISNVCDDESFSFPKECRACEVSQKLVFEVGGV